MWRFTIYYQLRSWGKIKMENKEKNQKKEKQNLAIYHKNSLIEDCIYNNYANSYKELMEKGKWEKRSFAGADFSNLDLSNTDFKGLCLEGAVFKQSNLKNCDFRYCDLRNCDFKYAILDGCLFTGSNLEKCDFYRAELPDFQIVPSHGSFIGWKKGRKGRLMKILVPEDAERTNPLHSRICRCSHFKVLGVWERNGKKIDSKSPDVTVSKSTGRLDLENFDYNEHMPFFLGKEEINGGAYNHHRDITTIDMDETHLHFFISKEEAEKFNIDEYDNDSIDGICLPEFEYVIYDIIRELPQSEEIINNGGQKYQDKIEEIIQGELQKAKQGEDKMIYTYKTGKFIDKEEEKKIESYGAEVKFIGAIR